MEPLPFYKRERIPEPETKTEEIRFRDRVFEPLPFEKGRDQVPVLVPSDEPAPPKVREEKQPLPDFYTRDSRPRVEVVDQEPHPQRGRNVSQQPFYTRPPRGIGRALERRRLKESR